jgi:hypothetical protein
MRHDPRTEAFDRLGGAYEVRVLEPSPPAVAEGPWFADDPAARGAVPDGRELVSPVSTGDVTWDAFAHDDSDLSAWAADRWLGAWHRLESLPERFAETRERLHALAEGTIAPAREAANSKIGMRYTRGGFGTPFFGADEQLRVDGAELVTVRDGEESAREPIEGVDGASVAALGDWYGLITTVLEELRAQGAPSLDPSRVQLWPEHFDMSTELGSEASGVRAGYGGSPGDADHREPYLYVVPWSAKPSGALWRAAGFDGAELSYAELLEAGDQRAASLEFFSLRLEDLVA